MKHLDNKDIFQWKRFLSNRISIMISDVIWILFKYMCSLISAWPSDYVARVAMRNENRRPCISICVGIIHRQDAARNKEEQGRGKIAYNALLTVSVYFNAWVNNQIGHVFAELSDLLFCKRETIMSTRSKAYSGIPFDIWSSAIHIALAIILHRKSSSSIGLHCI